jgi:hypothetical protein
MLALLVLFGFYRTLPSSSKPEALADIRTGELAQAAAKIKEPEPMRTTQPVAKVAESEPSKFARAGAKIVPDLQCSQFVENFKSAAEIFNAHRREIISTPQANFPTGRQITNWPEIQVAYDCKFGVFAGFGSTLIENDRKGRDLFGRFIRATLLAAVPQAQPQEIDELVGRLEKVTDYTDDTLIGGYAISVRALGSSPNFRIFLPKDDD